MADNIQVTEGLGKAVATDDCGAAGHTQVMKLAISADGSAVYIPATAANGLTVDVTRLPALPAGTNNIGDVDVLTVPADPFGVNADAASATGSISAKLRFIASTGIPVTSLPADPFGANADAASATGSISAKLRSIAATGIPVTAVPADPFGANADAASATGSISAKLRFISATGIPVTSLPNVTLAAGTNTNEVVGDAAHDAAAAGNPLLMGGFASATAPAAVSTDGDAVRAWHLLNGAAAVAITAAGALVGGDATNGLDVDLTRASFEMVDNDPFTNGTTKIVPAGYILDETAGTALTENDGGAARIDAKRAQVFVLEDQTTRTQRANVSALGGLQTDPRGNVAHDAVDSGNPVKVGGRAAALGASVTLVAVADRTDLVTDLDGAMIVRDACQLGDIISDTLANTDGNSTAFAGSFAATANVRNYISAVSMANTSVTPITVNLRDGTGGSTLYTFMVPAGGGIVVPFMPPLRQPTVNTALAIDGSAAVTTLTVSVNGFKSKA